MDEIITKTVNDIVAASAKFKVIPEGQTNARYWTNELVKRLPKLFLYWLHIGDTPTNAELTDVAAICLLWISYLVEYIA